MAADPVPVRERAIQLLRMGMFGESIESLQEALDENPTDVELYLYLGYAHAQQQELSKSIDVLERAVGLAPSSAKAHYNLGVAYHKSGNLTIAKDEYLRALGLEPTYLPAKQALDNLLGTQSTGGTRILGDTDPNE